MNSLKSQNLQTIVVLGLLAGAFILYTGAVGMIAAFHEREVVKDVISLGQLLLVLAPFVAAYTAANRIGDAGAGQAEILAGGVAVGILTAIPTIVLLLFNSEEYRFLLDLTLRVLPLAAATYIVWPMYRSGRDMQIVIGSWLAIAVLIGIVSYSFALIFEIKGDLRTVLVNIDRDWVEVVTFDHRRELVTGIVTLAFVSGAAGLAGSIFRIIPTIPRKALLYGLGVTLLVGAFGETVRLILQENLDRDTMRELFQRDTLRQQPALMLLIISTVIGFLWAKFGQRVRTGFSTMEYLAAPRRQRRRHASLCRAALDAALAHRADLERCRGDNWHFRADGPGLEHRHWSSWPLGLGLRDQLRGRRVYPGCTDFHRPAGPTGWRFHFLDGHSIGAARGHVCRLCFCRAGLENAG